MPHVPAISTEITFDEASRSSDECDKIESEITLGGASPEGEEVEEGYEIESVIGMKRVKRKGKWYTLYLIKWLGYEEGDATWELMDELYRAADAVTEHERSQGWHFQKPYPMGKVRNLLKLIPLLYWLQCLSPQVPLQTTALERNSTELRRDPKRERVTGPKKVITPIEGAESEGAESEGAESEGAGLVSSSDNGEESDDSDSDEESDDSDSDEKSDESAATIADKLEQWRLQQIVRKRGCDWQL